MRLGWLGRLFSGAPQGRPLNEFMAEQAVVALSQKPAASGYACRAPTFDQRDNVNARHFNWLFDAEGESEFDPNALETRALDALSGIVNSEQSGAALVRRLPGLIPKLLQSLRSVDFSGAQLARTISGDVVLVAAVIRLANNACKGSGKSIASVEHAIMLIGHEGLRHLITGLAFRPIIDMNSGHFTRTLAPRIWDQSERCAEANHLLACTMDVDPFEAFLAGLVQNVGLIVALRLMDQSAKGETEVGSETFRAHFLRDARSLSCSIGCDWGFPENVMNAIREQAEMGKGRSLSPLGSLLTLSDYLSKIHILAEHERLDEADRALFDGLPPHALHCYRALDRAGQSEIAAGALPAR